MPYIAYKDKPDDALFFFRYNGDTVSIGRDKKRCLIHLGATAQGVSRIHLHLYFKTVGARNILFAKDLSTYGTVFNGEKLSVDKAERELKSGDSVQVGNFHFLIKDLSADVSNDCHDDDDDFSNVVDTNTVAETFLACQPKKRITSPILSPVESKRTKPNFSKESESSIGISRKIDINWMQNSNKQATRVLSENISSVSSFFDDVDAKYATVAQNTANIIAPDTIDDNAVNRRILVKAPEKWKARDWFFPSSDEDEDEFQSPLLTKQSERRNVMLSVASESYSSGSSLLKRKILDTQAEPNYLLQNSRPMNCTETTVPDSLGHLEFNTTVLRAERDVPSCNSGRYRCLDAGFVSGKTKEIVNLVREKNDAPLQKIDEDKSLETSQIKSAKAALPAATKRKCSTKVNQRVPSLASASPPLQTSDIAILNVRSSLCNPDEASGSTLMEDRCGLSSGITSEKDMESLVHSKDDMVAGSSRNGFVDDYYSQAFGSPLMQSTQIDKPKKFANKYTCLDAFFAPTNKRSAVTAGNQKLEDSNSKTECPVLREAATNQTITKKMISVPRKRGRLCKKATLDAPRESNRARNSVSDNHAEEHAAMTSGAVNMKKVTVEPFDVSNAEAEAINGMISNRENISLSQIKHEIDDCEDSTLKVDVCCQDEINVAGMDLVTLQRKLEKSIQFESLERETLLNAQTNKDAFQNSTKLNFKKFRKAAQGCHSQKCSTTSSWNELISTSDLVDFRQL